MPKAFVISQNELNVLRLRELSSLFPSIRVIAINASHVAQGDIAKYRTDVHSEDLIVLDHTGEIPEKAISEGVRWAKGQQEIIGVSVAEITNDRQASQSPTEGFVSWPMDFLKSEDGVCEVVRLLYRSVSPVNASPLPEDSEEFLTLAHARAMSLITIELFCSSQIEEKTIHFDEFAFASRLLDQLSELLWVQFSESLAARPKCEFFGLGKFERSYVTRELAVSFTPEVNFAEMLVPDINVTFASLKGGRARSIPACFPHLPVGLYKLLSQRDVSADVSLAHVLCSIFQTTMRAAESNPNERVRFLELPSDYDQPCIRLFAEASGFAAYCFLIASMSRSLKRHKELVVPVIGTFALRKGGVEFSAAVELLELINANPLAQSAGTD